MRSLLDLPAEIHHQIASYLLYPELSKYQDALKPIFVIAPTEKQMKKILYQTDLHQLEVKYHIQTLKFACFACLTTKEGDEFTDFFSHPSDFHLGCGRSLERVCKECDAKKRWPVCGDSEGRGRTSERPDVHLCTTSP